MNINYVDLAFWISKIITNLIEPLERFSDIIAGIIYALTALGVGGGYIGGGQFLSIYVDFNTVDR